MRLKDEKTGKMYDVEDRCAVEVDDLYSSYDNVFFKVTTCKFENFLGRERQSIKVTIDDRDDLSTLSAKKLYKSLGDAIKHAEEANAK